MRQFISQRLHRTHHRVFPVQLPVNAILDVIANDVFDLLIAALNVLINLGSLKDEAFVADRRAKLEGLLAGKGTMRDQIYDYVVSKL